MIADQKLLSRPITFDEPEERKSIKKRDLKEESKIKPADDWDSKFQLFTQNSPTEIHNLEIQKQKSSGQNSQAL